MLDFRKTTDKRIVTPEALSAIVDNVYRFDAHQVELLREDLFRITASNAVFIARTWPPEEKGAATFSSALQVSLHHQGFSVEPVIVMANGATHTETSSGISIVVYRWLSSEAFSPSSEGDYAEWGRYVACFHQCTGRYLPEQGWLAPLVANDPDDLIAHALRLSTCDVGCRKRLEGMVSHISTICRRVLSTEKFGVIHGDLWPGNLLKHEGRLTAIDFRESGLAPIAIDWATAFRWMPWDNLDEGTKSWESWCTAYKNEVDSRFPSHDAIRGFAALQSMKYMVEEVHACLAGHDSPDVSPEYYVHDHVYRIEQMMSVELDGLSV